MKPYTVVIPNRFPDIIQPFLQSVRDYIPQPYPRIIIVANEHENDYGFEMIKYPYDKFQYAKAVNIGILAAGTDDVFLMNDDIVLLNQHFFRRMSAIAHQYPQVGILSPLVKGGVGNQTQYWYKKNLYWRDHERIKHVAGDVPVCFPCVLIKRELINDIGLLNEKIKGYGGDDVEYCLRARANDWKTSVTSLLVVQHGDGGPELNTGRGKTWSTSFARI